MSLSAALGLLLPAYPVSSAASVGGAPLGFMKWMIWSSLTMCTSSTAGMVFTPSRLSVFCSRLSSVEAVLWTAFFFLCNHQPRVLARCPEGQAAG